MNNNANQRLKTILLELCASKDVELPAIPDNLGRSRYLEYIQCFGYSESELLPMVQHEKLSSEAHGAILAGLMQAIDSDDKTFVQSIVWMALNSIGEGDNTNLLIHRLSEHLLKKFRTYQDIIPDFYAGVFPID
ncbi:MAG: hypothetical protein MI867_25490, partial [Pseudomonadales bacterium]|nr:hypothetical protein [Pseudomonadales bacterium]